jgi:hypothetical protein
VVDQRGLARITLQSASEFASGALFLVQLQANSTRHQRIVPENYEANRKTANEFVIRPEGTAIDLPDSVWIESIHIDF